MLEYTPAGFPATGSDEDAREGRALETIVPKFGFLSSVSILSNFFLALLLIMLRWQSDDGIVLPGLRKTVTAALLWLLTCNQLLQTGTNFV